MNLSGKPILLFSSIAVTLLLLIGVAIVSHDALTIREAEEVEEDSSKLLLHAERWLNHQQAMEIELRDYVLFGEERHLASIDEDARASEEHVAGMAEALGDYPEDADSQMRGLLKYKDQHLRLVREVIDLKQAGADADATRLLASPKAQHYLRGAGLIVDNVAQFLQQQRSSHNSEVSFNVLRGSVSFAAMAVIMIATVWAGYAINRRILLRNEELSARLAFEASHDTLTGLPNRRYMRDHLVRAVDLARRHHLRLALMMLDLDGFKPINDAYGHESGDAVLVEVAKRLKHTARASDFVVRIGGDEFAVVAENVGEADAIENLAQRLVDAVNLPIGISGGRAVHVGCSIGIALLPEHAQQCDALFAAADGAMYEAKSAGKNQWRMAKGLAGLAAVRRAGT